MAERARLVAGVDGGGSKTVALVADESRVLGRGSAGASNYQAVGVDSALAALDAALAAAAADAGLTHAAFDAVCVGMAGVDRPADHALLRAWAEQRLPRVPVQIVNDAQLVLAAGTPDGWGAALICGTGSIVYGADALGRQARAGGWGHLMGDEGSGYAVGQAALAAVMRAFDGRGPATALTQAVLAHWGLGAPPDLVGQVYRESLAPAQIAALAPAVEAAAAGGDELAQAILREAGGELALAVHAVVQALALPQPTPCALAGSLIVKGAVIRQHFLAAALALGLELVPLTPVHEPAQGAVRLARALVRP